MPINRTQVQHIAALARIALSEDETDAFARQLSDILDHFDALQRLDTAGVLPTAHAAGLGLDADTDADASTDTILRADDPAPSLDAADTLRNAPRRHGDFFRVRAVLDE